MEDPIVQRAFFVEKFDKPRYIKYNAMCYETLERVFFKITVFPFEFYMINYDMATKDFGTHKSFICSN